MHGVWVFCNNTATTELDTYSHTLSLHDALPIYRARRARARAAGGQAARGPAGARGRARGSRRDDGGETGADHHRRGRSEEQTSELQSLMRSSYAVFCLKITTALHSRNSTPNPITTAR